jgi:hypothetical protein
VLLAASFLAVMWCGAVRASAPVPAPAAPAGYLRIVAVAPGYDPAASASGRWLIYLDGFIDTGAAGRFERLLERRGIGEATVYLNSPGGHLVEAMRLGREIRARGFDTVVGARSADSVAPRPGLCYSACPFAFAGGVRRSLEPGSSLGVHRAANRVPVADEADFQGTVASQAGDYLAEMGVSTGLVALMAEAPHDSIRDIAPAEAAALHLVTPSGPDAR